MTGAWSARAALGAAAVLALLSCAVPPSMLPRAPADEARLFETAYASIAEYYLEPVTPASLAVAGLSRLESVDGLLTVSRVADSVVLRHGGTSRRFAAPESADATAWAQLTGAVMSAARDESAAVAALPPDGLDQTVIEGSLAILDRFSHYSPPDVARERRAARDGFGGIGITLDPDASETRVSEILPETPAALVGMHVDDRILTVDGVDMTHLARPEVAQRLRGAPDSTITVVVRRAGGATPLTFTMRRARIVPPSVTLKLADSIAHLRVSAFNQQTAQTLAGLLEQAHRATGGQLRGVILDLRGNPGGLLDQSVEVASLFLEGGSVTSTVGRAPESMQSFSASRRGVERLPLVVLINGGSASASEIVAAALQDAGRAIVVGTASYGKGTVQNVQRLPNDGELTITWARLVAPGGYVLHHHGVVPTVCTAQLAESDEAVTAALRRAASGELSRSRAVLDDQEWQTLRSLCPAQREERQIDLKAARRLLSDAALYARTLGTSPPVARDTVSAAMH